MAVDSPPLENPPAWGAALVLRVAAKAIQHSAVALRGLCMRRLEVRERFAVLGGSLARLLAFVGLKIEGRGDGCGATHLA